MFWLFVILVLNAGISYWNAYVCGRSWEESKAVGGAVRFMVWCGAIQSAAGFSSVIMFPLVLLAHVVVPQYFTEVYLRGAVSLWYITVIFPVLGTGLAITVESWVRAYRERDLLSMGVASWNTFAQIHNTVSAVENLGSAFGDVAKTFASVTEGASDSDDPKATLAIVGLIIMVSIVIIAIGGGALLTAVIIKRYAGTVPLPIRVPARSVR